MFKCGKQLYRSYLLSGLLSKKALSSPSHLLHLLSCFCPLHVARASGQHPRPLGPHSASSRLAAKISSRKHLPSLWHVFLRENLDQTIPYTFTFTFIWEPKRLYHNTLSIYTISMFSLLASSNAVKYRPTLTSNIPQLSPTVRSISSLPGLDVPPLPGSSRSSPPPGLSPAAPSRSWTAPPWRGSQRRRTDPRWRPGCAPRVRRRVPGARSVSWSSGGFPRAAKTGKDPLFEDFWRAGGYLANWTVNWMGHLKKFVHKRCNACWRWWLQEVPTPKAPGSKGGCLFLALFWPPGSWQTTKLGMLSNCQQQKKKRPKSTNVSKFQVAAAAHEACRSSQEDFLCLLFFNHRALARLIACCSSIGPLFQLLLGDVLEEANASPKLWCFMITGVLQMLDCSSDFYN